MSSLRVLSSSDVEQCIDMRGAISAMREAFADLSSGRTIVPQRTRLEMSMQKSRALVMPVYSSGTQRYGTKIVSLSDRNPSRNLPFIHGLMLVFDADTGIPLGLMNAEKITALRTGAASGLATDLLSRKDSATAVILGAGTQARAQLEAVVAVRPVRQAYVYGIKRRQAEVFAEEMSGRLGISVRAASGPEIVAEADIICTATTSSDPVFRDGDVKEGTHINGIGSYKPDTREIPAETMRRAMVVVDSRSSCLAEAGDLVIPFRDGIITEDHIVAELGELVLGTFHGRTSPGQITIFKSVGNAAQDLAVAVKVLEAAEEKGLGTRADI